MHTWTYCFICTLLRIWIDLCDKELHILMYCCVVQHIQTILGIRPKYQQATVLYVSMYQYTYITIYTSGRSGKPEDVFLFIIFVYIKYIKI